jgi:ubiquinone/menaquinone biosynthesis C-methylase UbiE
MVKQTQGEKLFWNDEEMAAYFAAKPADTRIIDFVETRYAEPSGLKALDLGCGGGRHSEFLAAYGFDVLSVDPNPGMRSATTTRLEALGLTAKVIDGEILAIPAKNDEFDLIVTTGVLHQANTSAEYARAIDELSRTLKIGGHVCLNIFTNRVWDTKYTVTSTDGYSVITAEGLPMTLLPKETFVEMMGKSGLSLTSDYPEDLRQENTGPRAVYRANFTKVRTNV